MGTMVKLQIKYLIFQIVQLLVQRIWRIIKKIIVPGCPLVEVLALLCPIVLLYLLPFSITSELKKEITCEWMNEWLYDLLRRFCKVVLKPGVKTQFLLVRKICLVNI